MNDKKINLVLLPGLDGTGLLFKDLIAELPAGINAKVIAYPPDRCLSLSEYAELVARQLPTEEVVLLAESFSGLVALTLMSECITNIKAVIFCASFAEPPRPLLLKLAPFMPAALTQNVPDFMLRRYCLGRSASAEQITSLRAALAQVSPAVLAHRLKLVASQHSFAKEQFSVLCHYIQATEDCLVPTRAVDWFENHLKNFTLKRIAGPHFLLQANSRYSAIAITKIIKRELEGKETK